MSWSVRGPGESLGKYAEKAKKIIHLPRSLMLKHLARILKNQIIPLELPRSGARD